MSGYDTITVSECLALNETGVTFNINDGQVTGVNFEWGATDEA